MVADRSMQIQPIRLKAHRPGNFTSAKAGAYVALLCAVIILLATKGITDEATVAPHDDMPRYMMNGAYFYDLVRDLPVRNGIHYTIQYFAKYPALSLGHHPLLPGIALVPYYAMFGISVFSARLMVVTFMLIAGITWFCLVRTVYDEDVALLSSLLLVTSPYIVGLSRVVMSEIPALALIILSTYYLYLYCEREKRRYAIGFVVVTVLSVYARHTAIFMFPFYLSYFILSKGLRSLFAKNTAIISLFIMLLILPLVPLTLKFSQYNLSLVGDKISPSVGQSYHSYVFEVLYRFWYILRLHLPRHLSIPVLLLSVISIPIALYHREKREMAFLLWIVILYVLSAYTAASSERHTIYWVPPFCLFATTLTRAVNYRPWKVIMSAVIIFIAGYQFAGAFRSEPAYAHGYEEASKYLVNNWKGDSVLYASMDTGYFIFFVRKHIQNENIIVLRANKMLATSEMSRIVEDRIQSRSEIYEVLDTFGTAFVVLEDQKFDSPALEWLREEVKSDGFILHKRIPIRSSHRKLRDVDLAIYEYKGYTQARTDAILQMNIPLMGDSIRLRFSDLLKEKSE